MAEIRVPSICMKMTRKHDLVHFLYGQTTGIEWKNRIKWTTKHHCITVTVCTLDLCTFSTMHDTKYQKLHAKYTEKITHILNSFSLYENERRFFIPKSCCQHRFGFFLAYTFIYYTARINDNNNNKKKPDPDNYHAGSVRDHEHYSKAKRRGRSDVYICILYAWATMSN